ncbi:hypothetical protein AF335_15500 [Streptomyces eurocidicus]|uniref:Uncharacterized protein n=1 Tax=Streptomyces eurocidicus TaxID=66423 RepID=A0A2N8NVW1_STREU|nr:hypothetical protein [Streptomyces eurocidicus]MBB5119135.1 hypothetical protein [Streptomyces eurocidicus]MBF6050419.1 hypothetical protein [Streptomyces eurocidicus]PNE32916.1 hypothetical protein AF335_15500 [Streptomyces eurocidicus]
MKKIVILLAAFGALLMAGVAAFLYLYEPDGSAERSEIVGSWYGSRGARLTFREDGTLTAVGVPAGFSDDHEPVNPFTGEGTWTLEKKPKLGDQEIHLFLGDAAHSTVGTWMEIRGKGARDGLCMPFNADTVKGFTFKRSS